MKNSKLNRAVEYIKEDLRECEYENRINHNELLNILQGEDTNVKDKR